jgi:hypothetical protein
MSVSVRDGGKSMKVVDLLRNHPWNMQALITVDTVDDKDVYTVLVQTIHGPDLGLDKTVTYPFEKQARDYALTVLGMDD